MYDDRAKKTEYKTFIFNCHTGTASTECQLHLASLLLWIELVAAVKVFEIEERREIAAGHALADASAGHVRLRFLWSL